MDTTITIPKQVTGRADLEVEDALKKIKRGEQEYKNGQTKATFSTAY